MAVRQYIGARYTIKVYENSLDPSSAEWESGRSYEPLTLVTYNNSSYLSKKQVAAGVGNPASNPTYWVCTGYYNGQIMQLQSDVAQLLNDLGDIDDLITFLDGNVVEAINSAVTEGEYNGVVMLTDSFGENVTPNISTLVPSQMGWDSDQYLMHVRGGCGFGSNAPYQYLTELQGEASNIIAKFGSADKVTCVIVTGGTNDAYYGNTELELWNAAQAFISYVKSTYPNAKVKLFFTGWTDAHNAVPNLNIDNLKKSMRAWEFACTDGSAFYDCHNALHQHSLFNGDHIHPTVAAQYIIANMITSMLKGGQYQVHRELIVTMTPDAAFSITGDVKFRFNLDGDVITANIEGVGWFGYADIATASGGSISTIKFGTISDWMMAGGYGRDRLKGFMVVNDGGGAKVVPCEFTFQSGDVYISIGDYHTTVVNNYNINGPSQGTATFSSYMT